MKTLIFALCLGLAYSEAALAQFIGKLRVEPTHGAAGTLATIRGAKLPPNESFELAWTTVRGRWNVEGERYLGREYRPALLPIGKVRSDAAGNFESTFRVPEDFGFLHDIVLRQGDRLVTQTAFQVDMSVAITPSSGRPGTPITVEVKGIGWRELENSWMLLYDNAYTGWISAVTTAGSASFTIPATGRPGVHVLEVLHGDFTFAYRNMQQSPRPDRPRFVREFTITPGEAVLPPPVTAQAQKQVRRLPVHEGELEVSRDFGSVGEPLEVRARGLAPNRPYQLRWSTVVGNRVAGAGWEESARVVATARADASGAAAFRLALPDDLGGAHALMVQQGDDRKTGLVSIVPSALPLAVSRGPAGTRFTLHLKGVGWTETANIYTVVYDNAYIGYACGFNSQGDVQIDLHATGAPGWHFIDLYPAIYKGKEARPINFRIPQLTYEADHPGEDLPAFRFAFEITESPSSAR